MEVNHPADEKALQQPKEAPKAEIDSKPSSKRKESQQQDSDAEQKENK